MTCLLERVDDINLRKLMEGSREDLLKSFFSLIKTNAGRFKSDKQAAFLTSQTENGVFFITQTLNFGTSSASQRRIDWTVVLDEEGVVKITKRTNSKGEELYWERGNAATIAAKRDEQRTKNIELIKTEMRDIVDGWKRHVAEKETEIERMKAALDDPAYAQIRDRLLELIPKAEAEIAEYKSRIDSENAKWGWDQ